ncbi:MAG: hypothetical protein JEZ06_12580 [Anaerolineaceae bacterium]|nr:hypothetical protein [Anaerolineaceae bacterium]
MKTKDKGKELKGQKISAYVLIGVGILHTLAHFLIPQPREALFTMIKNGLINSLGPDWAAANFSVSMSLAVGFSILFQGIVILQMGKRGWQVPFASALTLLLLYLFIVAVGPNGGGWLALPSCVYLMIKAWPNNKTKIVENL